MNNLFIKSMACVIAMSASLMASGPRVTATLFEPIQNEIVALETPALYSSMETSGGMAFEIAQAALGSENETATLTTYPVQKMVKYYITQEKTLAALGVNFNLSKAEEKNVVALPVAFIRESYVYYKPAHPQGLSLEGKLSKLKGTTYGASPGEDASEYEKAGVKVVYGESRFLFEKLKTQEVDFIKEPMLSSTAMINSNFSADKNKFGVMKSQELKSVCMILFNLQNEKGKEISKKFRKGLLSIIENGQYKKILEKHQGKTDYAVKYVQELEALLKREF